MVLCHADDDVVAIEQFARKLSLHVPRSIYTELLQSLERPRVDRLRSGSNAGRADIPAGDTVIREILLEALLRSHAPEYISRADEQHALWCFHRPIIRHVGRCGGGEIRTHDALRHTGFRNRRTRPTMRRLPKASLRDARAGEVVTSL